MVELSLAN